MLDRYSSPKDHRRIFDNAAGKYIFIYIYEF
jgi:hypothetical protein